MTRVELSAPTIKQRLAVMRMLFQALAREVTVSQSAPRFGTRTWAGDDMLVVF